MTHPNNYNKQTKADPGLRHITRWLLGTTTHGALLLSPPPLASSSNAASQDAEAEADGGVVASSYHVSHTGRGEVFLGLPPVPSLACPPEEALAALKASCKSVFY